MDSAQANAQVTRSRLILLGLSLVSLAVCAGGAVFHYKKWAWGNLGHPVGWVLSMLFLLLAVSPSLGKIASNLRSSVNAKAAFFLFWVLIFTGSHLWLFHR